MNNRLDREFTFGSLLRFALPSIIMLIFTALYTVVDGVFVSRFVGEDALAAINIVFPAFNLLTGAGFMLATGGSAIVAHRMGGGNEAGARQGFSLLLAVSAGVGAALSLAALLGAEGISAALGGTPRTMGYCVTYLRTLLLFSPAFMLQFFFQSFFVTAGRPGLGLGLSLAAGGANAALDFLLIVPGGLGVAGAALATAAGALIPAVFGLCFFAVQREGLRFTRPVWDGRMLARACANGSSEMVSNLAGAVITFFYNALMLRFLGEAGVSAITVVLYAQFLLASLYLGFSMGVAPVVSFCHGAENWTRLRRIFRICTGFVAVSSLGVTAAAVLLAGTVVSMFTSPGTEVYQLACHGFYLFAPSFLFSGLNIFASSFFTALNDGRTSAILSFLRTMGFLAAMLALLPALIGVDGVWLAVPAAELLCGVCTLLFLRWGRGKYHYGNGQDGTPADAGGGPHRLG